MTEYLIRRVLQSVLVIFLITILTFLLLSTQLRAAPRK